MDVCWRMMVSTGVTAGIRLFFGMRTKSHDCNRALTGLTCSKFCGRASDGDYQQAGWAGYRCDRHGSTSVATDSVFAFRLVAPLSIDCRVYCGMPSVGIGIIWQLARRPAVQFLGLSSSLSPGRRSTRGTDCTSALGITNQCGRPSRLVREAKG